MQRCAQGGRCGVTTGGGLAHHGDCGLGAVAGGICSRQLKVVVAQHQRYADKAEAAVCGCGGTAQHGGSAGGAQCQQRTDLSLALQGDWVGAGAQVTGRAGVTGGCQAKTGHRRRLGVQREGDVDRAGIAGRVFGHQAQSVRTLRQRAAGQGVELGAAEGENTTGLHTGQDVAERRADARVQRGLQHGHANRVCHRAADAGVAGDAVRGQAAGIGLQGSGQRGRGAVHHHRGLAHHGQADQRAVAGGICSRQLKVVVAQHQRYADKAEAAVASSGGAAQHGGIACRAQRQQGAGIGQALQEDGIAGGAQVTRRAGVTGGCQAKTGHGRRLGVQREAHVHCAGIARSVFGHQAQDVRALPQRAASQAVQQSAVEAERATGLQRGQNVGEYGAGSRV